MTYTEVELGIGYYATDAEKKEVGDMIRQYLRGEPVYIKITSDERRVGAIARLNISDETIQDILHGGYSNFYYSRVARQHIDPIPENVDDSKIGLVHISGFATWTGRKNRVNELYGRAMVWLKDYEGDTVWSFEKPTVPKKPAYDKLGREINVGDFISYILYHFDNADNAAGIYYGKVTKIDYDGTVIAKNIKLSETDKVAEKRIKDSSLIVIMSKDLMDKLMMARLSIL